ncbi:NAD kinase [uncultured Sunxiuqinia sp.]|uniref:NAD kinase n=1 Tax=uncultured Sunxiuqinia sp. TaxID=1573825 RepID=UPI001984123B|nr:NAD kinase [Sunxiuqinia sp.]|tara:strand:+ start:55833 stop:56714 length:882 start_codon:yes stop_codon:yes gene_type:complete
MIIAIFGIHIDSAFTSDLSRLFDLLKERNIRFYMYKPFFEFVKENCHVQPEVKGLFNAGDDLPDEVRFLFSIGGDGTFLQSVLTLKNRTVPAIGLNLGRLGFLSDISREDMDEAIDHIMNGRYDVEERSVLQLDEAQHLFGDFNYALNEIAVTKLDTSSMIRIHTYLNEEYLSTYWADGLVIATATGSTAYSLSVGGPILTPDAKSLIITPIAPHNLTVRPIVVPDNISLRLQVEGRGHQFLTSLDSRSEAIGFPGELHIRKAEFHVKTLKLPGHSFFSTLRNKLMWGADKRN